MSLEPLEEQANDISIGMIWAGRILGAAVAVLVIALVALLMGMT